MRRPLWPLLVALAAAGCGEKSPDPATLPTVPAHTLVPQGAGGKAGAPPVKKAQRDPVKTGH
ncbi:unnamed protein product [Gemmataceae bacterium]|jgi:hypothetical protein|nr:unnamed protein product [Gemmataceae bacterium]VTU00724.1 unnamed protein product [Gemmataceae bacterium]